MIDKLIKGKNLTQNESGILADDMLNQRISDKLTKQALELLIKKGENSDEITGFAGAMKLNSKDFESEGLILMDTCGTGGDKLKTFNISTAAAFVLAAEGIKIAKHGNRSVSSKCGSADLLEKMGYKLECEPRKSLDALKSVNFCFLFAQEYHNKMKELMPIRREIGLPSIFNIVGPLSSPAKLDYQMIGVYKEELMLPVMQSLINMGIKRAAVVHGFGGMDELSLEGENKVLFYDGEEIESFVIDPLLYGFSRYKNIELEGGDANINVNILNDILNGKESPYKEAVILNAGLGLYVYGRINNLHKAMDRARFLINSSAVKKQVECIISFQERGLILDEIFRYKIGSFNEYILSENKIDLLQSKSEYLLDKGVLKRKSLKEELLRLKREYLLGNKKIAPIIGEIKRGSPSKGKFSEDIDIASALKVYEKMDVVGISVLADEKYFYARSDDVKEASRLTNKPLLYKEFIVCERQLIIARELGASVILLIAKMLDKDRLRALSEKAKRLNLEVIMEIHSEEEFYKVESIPFDILGINNRNLSNFETDIQNSIRLYERLNLREFNRPIISESGIKSKEDIELLISKGFYGVLMGEYLIKRNMGTKIKVCGIKSVDHAIYAAELGVDYVGLVFAESRRQIDVVEGKKIVDALKGYDVKTVGVFMNQNKEQIENILSYVSLDYLQLHGNFEEIEELSKKYSIIRAISNEECLEKNLEAQSFNNHFYLVDGKNPGSGYAYDWSVLDRISYNKPIFVAGGLSSENVACLIKNYLPFAVDVSSGVEINGLKDKNKIKEFIDACKSADSIYREEGGILNEVR